MKVRKEMRYSLYVYLYNMCNTLQEAAEYIQKSDGGPICYQLLANCVQVIDRLEKTLQSNKESVRNKNIFDLLKIIKKQCTDLLGTEGKGLNREEVSKLIENIIEFKKLYKGAIDITYRVVFFAELGQKWDSMSSVYDAFKNRKDCDVAVVLEPIYRAVNLGGTVKTDVIYEDYLTPLGIKHIPYKQYDISKDNPDLVFISNPYESVTLPQFWPVNIAKYARLVYLPYYTERVVDEESIQAHCLMPVVQYAWRIIAQSQKMKDLHIKYSPKHGENVLVTGLPKWDNINELKEKPNLPDDWKSKLKNRKVFLWNNHYRIDSDRSTLLEYGKAIIELFSSRNDIALIWRPHPMTETIFKLYYPQYKPFWDGLKEAVKKSDNMVIDKNKSYNLAFQCSDALITDFSSIMAQYMLTEKPILWLRKEQEAKEKRFIDYMIRIDCLEQATSTQEIAAFVDRIAHGIDATKAQRLKIMQEDMPSADGHIGERVCNLLLEELKKENGI